MQALIHLYETFGEALHTVQELEAAQIPYENISLLVLNAQSSVNPPDGEEHKSKKDKIQPTEDSKIMGHKPTFSSRLELHQLPGLEPVAACGWLVSSALENTPEEDRGISNAPPTGLMTCLTGNGIDKDHAQAYVEGIKHGSALIGVRATQDLIETALRIMREDHSPLNPQIRGKHYATGRFNPEEFARVKRSERTLAMLIAGASKT